MPNSQETLASPTNSTTHAHGTSQEAGPSSKYEEDVISLKSEVGTKKKGKRNRAEINQPEPSSMVKEKMVEPQSKATKAHECTKPKQKCKRILFPTHKPSIPTVETSAQGRRRTRSMTRTKHSISQVTSSKHVDIPSSPDSNAKKLELSFEKLPMPTFEAEIPMDIAHDLETLSPVRPSLSRSHTKASQHISSPKESISKSPGGSASQQSTTPAKTPTFAEEENLKIRLVKLQKKIVKLQEQANKYKVLFHYVREVNNQVRDSNLRLYANNDDLKSKNRQLLRWKALRFRPTKKLSAQGLALQFKKCSTPVKHGIEVLVKTASL